jgi:tRNA-binding EMAP/Myf-like protein
MAIGLKTVFTGAVPHKPLADMDGSQFGVIVNVDVKPDQFRRGIDGVLKLTDLNRANMLLYERE